jgi:hypothetical protein
MTARLDHARGLYLEGIRYGDVRAALGRRTGDRYTQHSTGVADGSEGFLAFFEPFLARHPQREIELARSGDASRPAGPRNSSQSPHSSQLLTRDLKTEAVVWIYREDRACGRIRGTGRT